MTLVETTATMGHDNVDSGKGAMAPDAMVMAGSENGSSDYFIDPVKERRMMRKFDVRCAGLWAETDVDLDSFTRSPPWVSCT